MEGARIALKALGHIRVPNSRCAARYRKPEAPRPGPRNPPIWCDLPAGHEGPHRHASNHHCLTMDREDQIEMVALPDVCGKCKTKWPCDDAEAVFKAIKEEFNKEPNGPGLIRCISCTKSLSKRLICDDCAEKMGGR